MQLYFLYSSDRLLSSEDVFADSLPQSVRELRPFISSKVTIVVSAGVLFLVRISVDMVWATFVQLSYFLLFFRIIYFYLCVGVI